MINKSDFVNILTILALILVSNCADPTFCWRDSTTRGAGTVPTICGANQQLIGLLCYDKCPSGYKRFGFDCHQTCLDGWRDDGLFCRLAEYGRGTGVLGWDLFKDGFGTGKTVSRCQAQIKAYQGCYFTKDLIFYQHITDFSAPCQMWGLIAYPACKPGYSAFGCCICRPSVHNCGALGFNGGIDLSCAKKIIIGNPRQGSCKAGEELNGLLCYPRCPGSFSGVGPVCWGNAPKGWVNCGMGAAKSQVECGKTVVKQITSVGTVVLNIATLGTSGSATIAEKSTKLPELLSKLQPLVNSAKTLWTQSQPLRDFVSQAGTVVSKASTAKSVTETLTGDVTKLSAAQIVSLSAEIASLFDPTGIASLVQAYTYDVCSKIKVDLHLSIISISFHHQLSVSQQNL